MGSWEKSSWSTETHPPCSSQQVRAPGSELSPRNDDSRTFPEIAEHVSSTPNILLYVRRFVLRKKCLPRSRNTTKRVIIIIWNKILFSFFPLTGSQLAQHFLSVWRGHCLYFKTNTALLPSLKSDLPSAHIFYASFKTARIEKKMFKFYILRRPMQ